MRMVVVFISLILLPIILLSAQEKRKSDFENKLQNLQVQYSELEKKYTSALKDQEKKIEDNHNLITTIYQSLSIMISFAGIFISILGIILTIINIIYGSFLSRKINKSSEQVNKMLKEVEEKHSQINKLDNDIQSQFSNVFKKLKEAETHELIERLINVPEDIVNLLSILLTRDILKIYFNDIKKAYLNHVNSEQFDSFRSDKIISDYFILFFQHFADLSLFDPDITDEFQNRYDTTIQSAFLNDALKSTSEIISACVNNNFEKQAIIIINYFMAINQSKFKNNTKIYEVTFDKLITKENRFKFYEFIKENPNLLIVKEYYGNILYDYYQKSINNESERLILKNHEEFIVNIKKAMV